MADYGKIINKSIETTRKFKWLWVYGLTLAATAGSSFNGSGSGNSSSKSSTPRLQSPSPETNLEGLPKEFNQFLPTNLDNPKEVLGAFTTPLLDWVTTIEPQTWLLLVVGVLASAILGIIISLALSAWANGALIAGLKLAHTDQEVNLKNTSPLGIANIKNLILLGLIQFGIILATFVGAGVIAVIVMLISSQSAKGGILPLISVLLILVGVFGGLFLLIQFAFTMVYGQRYVVLGKLTPWEAWTSGWKLSYKNFFTSIVMGIINALTTAAFGCVTMLIMLLILGIPAFIFASPIIASFDKGFENLQLGNFVGNIIGLIILLLVFGVGNILIRGILVVFSASNWNLFFEEINKVSTDDIEKTTKKEIPE